MIAKILQNMGKKGLVTGGHSQQISLDINAMGIEVQKATAEEIVIDHENKIVSTPAYVEAKSIKEIAFGIEKLIKKVVEMA